MSRILVLLFFTFFINPQIIYSNENSSILPDIIVSVFENDYTLTETAIKNGADVNYKSKYGITPLMIASMKGHTNIAKLLIKNGANINEFDTGGCSVIANPRNEQHLLTLLKNKKIDDGVVYDTCSVLMHASSEGNIDIVKLLVANNVNIHDVSQFGYSALISASSQGHTEIVRLLLQNRADVEVVANTGINALVGASINGHVEVIKLLLQNGADIYFQDKWGGTALTVAIYNNQIEAAKLLMMNGADVNIETGSGSTPLTMASRKGYTEIVKLLLEYKADPSRKSFLDKMKPIDLAKKNGHTEIVKLFLAHDAKKNAIKSETTSAKHKENSSSSKTILNNKQITKSADIKSSEHPPSRSLIASMPKKPGTAVMANIKQDKMSLSTFTADQKPDTCVHVFTENPKPLTAVRLESMAGVVASWSTKGVKIPARGVLAVYHDGKLINANNNTFSLDVTQKTSLLLCMQGAEVIKNNESNFRIIFYYQDGTRSYSRMKN